MEKLVSPIVGLMAQTSTDLSLDNVKGTAEAIERYGIMPIMCAVLLLFSMAMFWSILRRNNRDETIIKLLSELTNTVNTIKNSDIDVAGSFDKHNTKFILEVEHIKAAIKSVEETLGDVDDDVIDRIRSSLASIDQQYSEIKDCVTKVNDSTKEIKDGVKKIQHAIEDLKK